MSLSSDPTTGDGSSAFSVVQGVFSFVSGEIAKSGPEAMLVDTPVATIGIRGTQVAIKVGAQGEDTVITLLEEEGGYVGEIVISNDAGTQVLNIANQTTQVASFSVAPTAPKIYTDIELEQVYGAQFDELAEMNFDFDEVAGDEAGEGEGVLDEEVEEEGEGEEEEALEGSEEVLEVEEALEVADLEEEALEEDAAEEGEDEISEEEIAELGDIEPAAGEEVAEEQEVRIAKEEVEEDFSALGDIAPAAGGESEVRISKADVDEDFSALGDIAPAAGGDGDSDDDGGGSLGFDVNSSVLGAGLDIEGLDIAIDEAAAAAAAAAAP